MTLILKCDVCGKVLDEYYYQNHWMTISGRLHQCNSMDDSFNFNTIICENCWDKAFPKLKLRKDSDNAKIYQQIQAAKNVEFK